MADDREGNLLEIDPEEDELDAESQSFGVPIFSADELARQEAEKRRDSPSGGGARIRRDLPARSGAPVSRTTSPRNLLKASGARIQAGRNTIQAGRNVAATARNVRTAATATKLAAGIASGGTALIASLGVEAGAGAVSFFKKNRTVIILGILTLAAMFGALLVFVLSSAFGDVASAGTTPEVVQINPKSASDTSALYKVLNSRIVSKEEAQSVINQIKQLRTRFTDASSTALMNDIEAAAQAIIDNANSVNEQTVAKRQSSILKTKLRQLLDVISPKGCGDAPYCLDVPAIGQGRSSACGITSVVMLILYYNRNYSDEPFYNPNRDPRNTLPESNTSCVAEAYINSQMPAGKKDWTRASYSSAGHGTKGVGKDAIIEMMKRSLAAGDPLVLFSIPPHSTIETSRHITTVVGYDPNDAAEQGGTFIIHNPSVKRVRAFTRHSAGGQKLTAEYIKLGLGGDGRYEYRTSLFVRRAHTQ